MSRDSGAAPAIDHAFVTQEALVSLEYWAGHSKSAAAWAAYDHLICSKVGMPYCGALDQASRDDARFWAETATPAELEYYALAAIDMLASSGTRGPIFASRHIKRLIGALWRRMAPDERKAFKAWIDKADTGE